MSSLYPLKVNKLVHAASLLICASLSVSQADAARHHHKHHVAAAAPKIVQCAVDPVLKPYVGLWYVTKSAKEDRSMKMRLSADGTFVFAGTTYKSVGRFSVKKGVLAFDWTEVDGQPVKAGAMHRLVSLS